MLRRQLALLLLVFTLALAGCKREPLPADPAIWIVEGAQGEKAWLFGTIHASAHPIAWRTPVVANALDQADEIMVEVANIADDSAVSQTFARLATTPGLPPLSDRIDPARRKALVDFLKRHNIDEARFGSVETWAAALVLAQAANPDANAKNGIDRAVIALANGRSVVELEGASGQLALFDGLPENNQRDLLGAVVTDPDALESEDNDLTRVWLTGDMARIERETRQGILANPDLRAVLFTGRNQRWTARIAQTMRAGRHPFVAVGAAHMAGPEGLPAMLEAKGFTVTRLH